MIFSLFFPFPSSSRPPSLLPSLHSFLSSLPPPGTWWCQILTFRLLPELFSKDTNRWHFQDTTCFKSIESAIILPLPSSLPRFLPLLFFSLRCFRPHLDCLLSWCSTCSQYLIRPGAFWLALSTFSLLRIYPFSYLGVRGPPDLQLPKICSVYQSPGDHILCKKRNKTSHPPWSSLCALFLSHLVAVISMGSLLTKVRVSPVLHLVYPGHRQYVLCYLLCNKWENKHEC
jgi:hypothetical protein